jgi:hypothetical protein
MAMFPVVVVMMFACQANSIDPKAIVRTPEIAKKLADVYRESIYEEGASKGNWKVVSGKRYTLLELEPPIGDQNQVQYYDCSFILLNANGAMYAVSKGSMRAKFLDLEKKASVLKNPSKQPRRKGHQK